MKTVQISNLLGEQNQTAPKPAYKFNLDLAGSIPAELRNLAQWVVWVYSWDEKGRWTKIPRRSNGGGNAASTNPATWSTFAEACDACKRGIGDGIGFMFTENDPYLGIDLDPYKLAKSGQQLPEMAEIISRCGSYTEKSPSGEGFHVIVKGKMPQKGRKSAVVEMYDQGRYFTFTGDRIEGSPEVVNNAQVAVDWLVELVFGKEEEKRQEQHKAANDDTAHELPDAELLEKLRGSTGSKKFEQLWSGQWEDFYPSQSEADLALAGMIVAAGAATAEQVDRLFRQSGLIRDKWDELRGDKTYGQMTVEKALESAPKSYRQEMLDQMNQRFAVVPVGGKVNILEEFENDSGEHDIRLMGKNDFLLLKCNSFVASSAKPGKQMTVANWWLAHSSRRHYKGIVFNPALDDPDFYNLWRGFDVKPQQGDCSLFWDLLHNVICAGNDDLYLYVRRWLAHLVQRPEEMPGVALVMRGGQGTGKNSFVDAVGKLIGQQHYMAVSRMEQVTGKFNAHFKGKLLLNANEASWGGNKSEAGALKALITDQKIVIEMKGKDALTYPNFLRVIVSSNENWAVPMDLDDRRFLALDVSEVHKQDQLYFAAFHRQMDYGGLEALMFDLQQEDLTGFVVRTKPESPFGIDMKLKSADSVTRWLYECLHQGHIEPMNEFRTSGTFTANDNWPKVFAKVPLFGVYTYWCKEAKEYHPEPNSGMFKILYERLGNAVSNCKPAATHPGERRVRSIKFSPLKKCRANFEKSIGAIGLKWPKV